MLEQDCSYEFLELNLESFFLENILFRKNLVILNLVLVLENDFVKRNFHDFVELALDLVATLFTSLFVSLLPSK